MRFITMHPALLRFYWEDCVWVHNLLSLGVSKEDIVIVTTDQKEQLGKDYPKMIKDQFGVQVFSYKDNRSQLALNYAPSIKPYLWTQLLTYNPEMANYDYLITDSDIIFREIPNFNKTPVTANTWYGSNTEGYTGVDYMNEKGNDFLDRIAPILGIPKEDFWFYKGRAVGAQWVISHPTLAYWQDVYVKSYNLFAFATQTEEEYRQRYIQQGRPDFFPYQSWVAEMTATLYLCKKHGITPVVTDELDFDWSSDLIAYSQPLHRKLIHNAGVTEMDALQKNLFWKGKYTNTTPLGTDLSWVNKDYVSHEYAQAIMNVGQVEL